MSAMRNLTLVLILCSLIAGCGFALQGSRPLPKALHKVTINYPQQYDVIKPPLLKFLKAEAERRGGWVVEETVQDATHLRILRLETDSKVLSISPITGRSIETLLSTAVEYELVRGAETVVPMDRIEVYREIAFDRNEVIAEEYEADDARNEMQRDLARLIFIRLEGRLAQDAG